MMDEVLAGLERGRAADEAGIDALAFAAAGRFEEYWESTIDEATERVAKRLATAVDQGNMGSGIGDSGGSAGGSAG